MTYPRWATPEARLYLVKLFLEHGNANPVLYFQFEDNAVATFKAQDREEREALWQKEQRELHRLFQIRKRGKFDSTQRQDYLDNRPVYRIQAIGVGAFTFKRVAKVAIPGLRKTIWVDLTGIVSKNKLRKVTRYHQGVLPKDIEQAVNDRIAKAVARHT